MEKECNPKGKLTGLQKKAKQTLEIMKKEKPTPQVQVMQIVKTQERPITIAKP